MTVKAGDDYAYAHKVTWMADRWGVGNAIAVATREAVYTLPFSGLAEEGVLKQRWQELARGSSPQEHVEAFLAAEGTTPQNLDQTLNQWVEKLEGVWKPLDAVQRIKIRNGFFTRNVAFSEKEGLDTGFGTVLAFRPKKAEVKVFEALFEGDPRRV